MKVLVRAVAAGAIGCAGLVPAAAVAYAQTSSDSPPEGALRPLDSVLAVVGQNTGLLSGNQVGAGLQAPVNVCGNGIGILGTAGGGSGSGSPGSARARSTMQSHGGVETTPKHAKREYGA